MRSKAFCLLLVAACAGCAGLLPRSEIATQETWKDYGEAQAAIEAILPMQTRRADLAGQGIDPRANAAITILTFSDVLQRFAGAVRHEELDSGVRQCLAAGKACTGYSIVVRRTTSRRIGNFWLDSFSFKRERDVTGWSFNALVLFVDDVVVYTLHGGQPRLHEKEITRNPLGPLQGWGQQVNPALID